jgi:hypothetical protein
MCWHVRAQMAVAIVDAEKVGEASHHVARALSFPADIYGVR